VPPKKKKQLKFCPFCKSMDVGLGRTDSNDLAIVCYNCKAHGPAVRAHYKYTGKEEELMAKIKWNDHCAI